MTGFVTVPGVDAYWLRNATVPLSLMTDIPGGVSASADGLAGFDVAVHGGRIEEVRPAGAAPLGSTGVDLERGQLWPCLIDVHTHLDKGHTWERAPNPDGTFGG